MVRFEPTTIGSHVGVLVVRNNLTAVSSVILKGEGGVGKLLLAGQEPGGTIVFDINASLLKASIPRAPRDQGQLQSDSIWPIHRIYPVCLHFEFPIPGLR